MGTDCCVARTFKMPKTKNGIRQKTCLSKIPEVLIPILNKSEEKGVAFATGQLYSVLLFLSSAVTFGYDIFAWVQGVTSLLLTS